LTESILSCENVLVHKTCQLLKLDWKIVIHHFYHEVIQCVDALDNLGALCGMVVDFMRRPTVVQLSHVFFADILGNATSR
jgi:hypothetical protein